MKLREKNDKLGGDEGNWPELYWAGVQGANHYTTKFYWISILNAIEKIYDPSKEARDQALGWCIWTNLIFCNLSFDEEFTSYL